MGKQFYQRNWVFATNSDFLIPLSLQPNVLDLRYFIISVGSNSLSLKYQRFNPSGCKDIGIRKISFEAKTQLLYLTSLLSTFYVIYFFSFHRLFRFNLFLPNTLFILFLIFNFPFFLSFFFFFLFSFFSLLISLSQYLL